MAEGSVEGRPLVGLIVPSSNPTIERALSAGAGRILGADFVVTRVPVRKVAPGEESAAQFSPIVMARAARLLSDAAPMAIGWAGTSGMWLGAGAERPWLDEMARVSACATFSGASALIAALEEGGAVDIAEWDPYGPELHADVVGSLVSAGYPVAASDWLGEEDNLALSRVPPQELLASVRRLGLSGTRRVAVVCTNVLAAWRDMPWLNVVDSLLATLWYGARLVTGNSMTYRNAYEALAPVVGWAQSPGGGGPCN